MRISVQLLLSFCLASSPVLLAQSSVAPAGPPPNPCAAAEQRQFDFWVGSWDATWPGQTAGGIGHGTNTITRILDGCVVEENFASQDATQLRGISVSIFNPNSGKWKQTWVDNQGSYLDFTGEFAKGQMVLQREAIQKNGTTSVQRMVWKNITPSEFDWSWETSADGGKTWQVQWPIHYRKKS